MTLLLTEDAVLVCAHELGRVQVERSQAWVAIDARAVLVENDPENRSIHGCPNVAPTIRKCCNTLAVREGYSELIRVGGRRVCLGAVTGFTDGTPPGIVRYHVREPGQVFVSEVVR